MVSQAELRELISTARELGTIIRTKHDTSGDIEAVSVGKLPDGEYRRLGEPGAGWMPVIQAAELLRSTIHIEMES